MKTNTRIYLDAFLQNMKAVAFFMFLPVLIARLGATPFEISLSNSLPPLFCAVSLAFLTRQLPLTRGVYYKAGMVRQIAFLCMAFSPLLPHPVFWLLFFWSFNAVAVMVTSVQQQALYRRAVPEKEMASVIGKNKVIGIAVGIAGSFAIGKFLDAHQQWFPMNYVASMVVGAVATFAGMSLMAKLAPEEKAKISLRIVRPLRTFPRSLAGIAVATAGIAAMGPIWTVYHVNELHLTNFQIGLFGIFAGLASTAAMPFFQKGLERWGERKVVLWTSAAMAAIAAGYGFVSSFWALALLQVLQGAAFSYYDIAQQTFALKEAKTRKKDEIEFFSDYQLVQNLSNGAAPLLTGAVMAFVSVQSSFVALGALKAVSVIAIALLFAPDAESKKEAS